MLKRIFLVLLVAALISVSAVAIDLEFDVDDLYQDQDTNYDPKAGYTLSNNGSYDGMGEIQSGWTFDGRGDFLRTKVGSGTYGAIRDVSTTNGNCLYRDLNKVADGKLFVETAVKISYGFDGLEFFFNDENGNRAYSLKTDDNAIWIMDGEGNYAKYRTVEQLDDEDNFRIRIYVDFADLEAVTVIDDVRVATTNLASDNFMRVGFATSDEDILYVAPSGVKITANYLVDEEFKLYNAKDTKYLPYGWTNRDNLNDAYIANAQAYVKNGSSLATAFTDAVNSGVLAAEFQMFANPDATGEVTLASLEGEKVTFSFDGTNFKLGNTVVYENYLEELWYRVRVAVDFENDVAKVYVNGRVVADDIALTGVTKLNSIKFTATGDGFTFDNVLVQSLVKADDYVPTPVKPADSTGKVVGINVCSLWSYESNHGWGPITPYDDFKPILGYYDEGSPEVADWEIKMMVEHGIDFQAFCWFADQKDAPLKYQSHTLQLHEGYMYAEYADMMNYCLLWEASNGAVPASVDAFKDYYVPYWIEHYFKDPRYLVLDNKPVLMVFGYGNFIKSVGGNEEAKECMDYLRTVLTENYGFDGLIVVLSNAADGEWVSASGADAVCRYNWGTAGKDLDYTIKQIIASADISKSTGTWTVPTLSTGFNSLPWAGKRQGNMPYADFEEGLNYIKDEYFSTYDKDKNNNTWQDQLCIISTWNEYGEGTFLMPVEGDAESFGYLDAVRNVLTDGGSHTDVTELTPAQLARINKNYPQYVRGLKRNDTYNPDVVKTLAAIATTVFEGYENFKVGACENVSYNEGVTATAKNGTAYVETADVLNLNIAEAAALSVEIVVDKATEVKVWYTTEDSQYYVEDQSVSFNAVPGTEVYTVDFVQKDVTLRSLRIMPTTGDAVTFTIKNVSILNPLRLYIDEYCIESKVFPENIDGTVYYPFDPTLAQGYIMNSHFTWDYAAGKLAIFADNGKWIEYTVGSDVANTDDGTVELPYEVYLSDNLPMLHMETLCAELGFEAPVTVETGLKIKSSKYVQNSASFTRPENEWVFTESGSNLGWIPDNVGMDIDENNELHLKAFVGDPRVYASDLNIEAAKYKAIETVVKYNSSRKDAFSFFFTTDKNPGWEEAKHVNYTLPSETSGDEYVTITIDLSTIGAYNDKSEGVTWKDTITALRLDPGHSDPEFECWIKSIKLIPNEDYVPEVSDAIKTEFTTLTIDAEDGEIPFEYDEDTTVVEVVADPADAENNVYMVTPSGSAFFATPGIDYKMFLDPGATYTVSFKYKSVNGDVQVSSDLAYVDSVKSDSYATVSSDWNTYTRTITVAANSFDRTEDMLSIYSKRKTVYNRGFYIDDIVITKTTSAVVNSETVVATDNGTDVTVSGSTETILPGEKSVVVALYNGTRLVGMKVVHLNETTDFSCNFAGATGATTAKIFVWTGMRTLAPQTAEVLVNVQ